MKPRKILVTSALPYANGPIHIGHLVEYIQTDIWVRFQKLRGERCIYLCADDTHGTAIMIRARQEGRSEEALIADMQQQHERDFASFGIQFDNYGSTNSEENRVLCGEFWKSIRASGLVKEKDINQLYDPEAKTFLADRFVRGTCPNCGTKNQPGDNCSKCGAHYSPVDLIDPVSTLSGATPVVKSSPHLFIELEQLHDFLSEWTQNSDPSTRPLQEEVANYLQGHFLQEPLRDWDISRPAPYFGFEIPDSPGNYWYVWFDAPIGYIASTWQWCKKNDENLNDWWKSDDVEIHHFIGKDITYFHTLFWPGMLKTAGYTLPKKVHIHGFLTVGGEKMSKSKGTFVKAETYAAHLDPMALRYYYASKLGPRLDDLDLNLEEFVNKVNADLVNKVVNLASRTAKFVQHTGLADNFASDIRFPMEHGKRLFENGALMGDRIAEYYEKCDFSAAMRAIMRLADEANQFVESRSPWSEKDPPQQQMVCTIALNLFRQIVVYLSPVLPNLAAQAEELFGQPIASWNDAQWPLLGTPVAKFSHMMKRIEMKDVEAMIEESKTPEAVANDTPASPADSIDALQAEPLAEECTIDDFVKIDLRIARVIEAAEVPEAKKLLKLTLSLGGDVRRTVFAGIKAAYQPQELVGRLVVMVANLKPRQMKFGLSEGMVCASGPGGEEVFLLAVDEGAVPGQRIH